MRAANTHESVKSDVSWFVHTARKKLSVTIQVIKQAEAHLLVATKARSYYKGQIDKAKESVKITFTEDNVLSVPSINARLQPRTNQMTMHFSFDMAQQVCTCSLDSFIITLILC